MSKGFPRPPLIPGAMPPGMGEAPAMMIAAPLNDTQLMMLMAAHIHAARVIGEPQSPDDPATAIDAKDSRQITVSALIAIELFGNVLVLDKETGARTQIIAQLRERFGLVHKEQEEPPKTGRAADRMPTLVTEGEQDA